MLDKLKTGELIWPLVDDHERAHLVLPGEDLINVSRLPYRKYSVHIDIPKVESVLAHTPHNFIILVHNHPKDINFPSRSDYDLVKWFRDYVPYWIDFGLITPKFSGCIYGSTTVHKYF